MRRLRDRPLTLAPNLPSSLGRAVRQAYETATGDKKVTSECRGYWKLSCSMAEFTA